MDSPVIKTLRALEATLESSLLQVRLLIDGLQQPRDTTVKATAASDDPSTCAHPTLVPNLPPGHYMCQTCGSQREDGGEWHA